MLASVAASVVGAAVVIGGGVLVFLDGGGTKDTASTPASTPSGTSSEKADDRIDDEPSGGPAAKSPDKSADGDRPMRIVTPKTLADGAYKLEKDTADFKKEGIDFQKEMPLGAVSVLARYQRAEDPTGATGLVLSGVYGILGEPGSDYDIDGMYKSFEEGDPPSTVVKKRREYRPEGADGPVFECEVTKEADGTYAPSCAWAEGSNAILVSGINTESTALASIDVEAFARTTARIYHETRKPA